MKNLLGQIWELYFIKNTPIHYIVMIKGSNGSSNINEIIRASLNSIFFFLQKDFACTKGTKKHQKAQKCNQEEAQNATKRTKRKKALKKHLSGKK